MRLPLSISALALLPLTLSADFPAITGAVAEPAPEPAGQAAPPNTPDSPAPVPSYAAAFEKLFALGLPDSRGGVFVKAVGVQDPFNSTSYPPAAPAFAWRMPQPDTPESAQKILVGGVALFERTDKAPSNGWFNAAALFADPARFAPGTPLPPTVTFRDADLKKEVENATKMLLLWQKARGQSKRNDRESYPQRLAPHLVLAAHAHRAGLTGEADRLAHAALACTTNPRAVGLFATSALADARWCRFLHAWTHAAAPDTPALLAELDALTTRFAQGWRHTPAARHLAAKLRAAAPGAPPEPAAPGHTFTPDQLRFARELLSLRKLPAPSDWIARPDANAAAPAAKDDPTLDFLRRQGVEALPLLAALADDESPTPCVPEADPNNFGFSMSGSSPEDSEELYSPWRLRYALSEWNARPLTRGEIARRFLAMPADFNFNSGDSDAYAARVFAAYRAIKAGGRLGMLLDLARSAENEWESRQAWQNAAGAVASDADAARFESALLESPGKAELLKSYGPLSHYLRQRGAKSAAFLKKFSAAARAELDELDDAAFSRTRNTDDGEAAAQASPRAAALANLDREIQQLELIVTPRDASRPTLVIKPLLDKVEREGTNGNPFGLNIDNEEIAAAIGPSGDPWEKLLPAVLKRAAKADDSRREQALLLFAQHIHVRHEATSAGASAHFTKHLGLWRALHAKAGSDPKRLYAVLSAAESLHRSRVEAQGDALFRLEEADRITVLQARFDARAEGKPLPPLPDAGKVPQDRLTAIVNDFAAAAPGALRERYARLTPDEKLAWIQRRAEPETLPAPLVAQLARIERISTQNPAAEAFAKERKLDGLVGRTFHANTLRELVAAAVPEKPPAEGIELSLDETPVGLAIGVYCETPRWSRPPAELTQGGTTRVSASLVLRNLREEGESANRHEAAAIAFGPKPGDDAALKPLLLLLEKPPGYNALNTRIVLCISIPKAPPAAKN